VAEWLSGTGGGEYYSCRHSTATLAEPRGDPSVFAGYSLLATIPASIGNMRQQAQQVAVMMSYKDLYYMYTQAVMMTMSY
jgi:hypothetical protein